VNKGDCCFNHIIGLPKKEHIEKPLFDYEKLLFDSLLVPDVYNSLRHTFKLKHLWVKKATGLRFFTEYFLDLWPGFVFTLIIAEIVKCVL
jgi:hypothetical protein